MISLLAVLTLNMASAQELDSIKIDPNPYYFYAGDSQNVKITGIPTGTNIRIFNVSGKMVREYNVLSKMDINWDLKDQHGDRIEGGVYLISCNNIKLGEERVIKFFAAMRVKKSF